MIKEEYDKKEANQNHKYNDKGEKNIKTKQKI